MYAYQFSSEQTGSVRDGQKAPVTCATCGCRLTADAQGRWYHFHPFAGRDARGCRVPCVDRPHDSMGHAAA